MVVLVGLPTVAESEGFDRTTLRLPEGHETLVEVVTAANRRTVVALSNGGAVEIGWADRAAAVLECYLGGQAGGTALVDVLFGDVEPGGRLAESFPVSVAELPAHVNFATHPTQVQYRETLYVGYRFHDTFDVAPRFCFGHGLGYTTFTVGDLAVEGTGTDLTATVLVRNTGERPGSEVVQLYVHDVTSTLHRPEQELKAFAKVHLQPGEAQTVSMGLDRRSFAVYDTASGSWVVEAGRFEIRVGTSSRDIRVVAEVDVASDDVVTPVPAPAAAVATDAEFAALLGRPVPAPRPLLPLTEDSTIDDLRQVLLGRPLRRLLLGAVGRTIDLGDEDPGTRAMLDAVLGQMPLRAIVASSGGKVGFGTLDALLRVLNASALGRRPGLAELVGVRAGAEPAVEGRDLRQVVVAQREVGRGEVLDDARRGHRLGQHDEAERQVPRDDHLGGRRAVLLGDPPDDLVVEDPLARRQRAPRLGDDAVLGVELAQRQPAAGRGAARPG